MTRQRRWFHALAAVDGLARSVGGYTAYGITTAEYVGRLTLPLGLHDAVEYLRENGYERNSLAAAKFHTAPHDAVAHASYRRVPEEHPDIDARITHDYAPSECQYHVHLWPTVDGIEVFSHYEVRGDLVRGNWSYRRMREHYRPEGGETYLKGVTDLDL